MYIKSSTKDDLDKIRLNLGRRVREYRMIAGYTQKDVAKYLGIPPQRIQKYESGDIRIPAEVLIKIARVLGVSINTLVFGCEVDDEAVGLIEKLPSLKGYQFSITKLVHMILFFATTCHLSKTKLNKLLFYSDFLHTKQYGRAISEVTYVKLPHGPAPESYNAILGVLEGTRHIEITEVMLNEEKGIVEEQITAESFNRKLFTEEELEVLRKVALHLGGKTGAELSKMTHQEPFFDKLELGKPIDYEFAKELKTEL